MQMKKIAILVLAMCLVSGSIVGCKSQPQEKTKDASEQAATETNASYLETYFGVKLSEESLNAESFSEAIKGVAGDEAEPVEGNLTALSAIKAAVKAADYDELALSYTEDKVKARMEHYGIKKGADAYLLTAMDTGLVSEEEGITAIDTDEITVEQGQNLLMAIANANGDARNYLGYSNDVGIYSKVDNAWNSFLLFDNSELSEIGKNAVLEGVTTGYGLKSKAYDAKFLPELTLQYGHSDIKHAHQLLGLLNSENIVAKVQLEPKISIYQYLLEWGPIPESTPTYEVKKFSDDLYLVYAVEYDMQLEFANKDDMLKFDEVINTYAKKNEGNEEAKGLIYSSWWQPLYSTTVSNMPEDSYHEIIDCVIENGMYSIHPFCLPENQDEVISKLEKLAGTLEVTPIPRYCNTAFYHYMKGEDYQ
ncbi:MAG: hypothetical protein ACERKN_12240 [Velocimicrobium sp.]